MGMVSVSNHQPIIIRTERGLTISGTRITLYDVMDYLTAKYPPKFIRSLFDQNKGIQAPSLVAGFCLFVLQF